MHDIHCDAVKRKKIIFTIKCGGKLCIYGMQKTAPLYFIDALSRLRSRVNIYSSLTVKIYIGFYFNRL